uniref:Uncharacterized protein n=1 Tax=Aegilops tauschii subsp. strangulata TaxID=200361 RepID=A0A453M7L2_AEGTS
MFGFLPVMGALKALHLRTRRERSSGNRVVASCLNTRMSSPREPFAALANPNRQADQFQN